MRISRLYIVLIMTVVTLTAVYVSKVVPASHSSAHPAVSGVVDVAQRTAHSLSFGETEAVSKRPIPSVPAHASESNAAVANAGGPRESDAGMQSTALHSETTSFGRDRSPSQTLETGWTINTADANSRGSRSAVDVSRTEASPVQPVVQRPPNPRDVTSPRRTRTGAFPSSLERSISQTPRSSVQPIDRDDDIAGYPLFRNYSPEDYGPDLPSQNWSVTQDDRGIIYVGNLAGVLSYDGATWRLIPTKNQTLVRSVFRDSTGRIYVGAYGEIGYLSPDATGTTRFVSLERKIPEAHRNFGQVLSGVAVESGVYFQTRRAIYRWDGSSVDVWTTTDEARFYKIFSVRDIVYVARENIGLHRIVNGQLEQIPGESDSRTQALRPCSRTATTAC